MNFLVDVALFIFELGEGGGGKGEGEGDCLPPPPVSRHTYLEIALERCAYILLLSNSPV